MIDGKHCSERHAGHSKEQQMLRHAALREFANKLKRELKPEEDVPIACAS
jgi:hypothetical protein